ncbi:MAG TPA: SelB C-terminal domain-containing protein [Chloroflexota bacterium]|nr:SelB C-terminal domain-containing protein [Chloroflexota bacterium]
MAKNDLFIIRQLSPAITLGGGQIVDPHPARRHRRRQPSVIAALELLARGTPEEIVLQTVELKEPAEPAAVVQASGLEGETARAALEALIAGGQVMRLGPSVLSASGWRRIEGKIVDLLSGYHRQHPLRGGVPREELKSRLGLTPRLFNEALAALAREGKVVEQGASVRLATHEIQLTPAQEKLATALQERLESAPLAPPSLPEIRQSLPTTNGAQLDEDLLSALSAQGRIVRVSEDLVFAAPAYNRMVERVKTHLNEHGKITVAEVRDLFGTSRRYVLALLEHLDRERVTRRVGDERVLGMSRQ